MSRRTLSIDIETYSDVNLPDLGVYRYATDPSTEIMIFAYAYDLNPRTLVVIDCMAPDELGLPIGKEGIPQSVLDDIVDPAIVKTAFNAAFEFNLFRYVWSIPVEWEQWRCTAVHSLYMSLPGDLARTAAHLFPKDADKQKDKAGKALITKFSKPKKPSKRDPSTRRLPAMYPDDWSTFCMYCGQDVIAEMAIAEALKKHPMPQFLWDQWYMDQRINDRGIRVDMDLVLTAIEMNEDRSTTARNRAIKLTQLENPSSVSQLSTWLADMGVETESLDKAHVEELLARDIPNVVREVLSLRKVWSGTAVKKYDKIRDCICPDGRVHGLLQFYGASRTGREAGRLIQPQNLKKLQIEDEVILDAVRRYIKQRDFDMAESIVEGNDVLGQLIRTTLVASPGKKMVVCDLSAIEARMLAWLAGEQWVLDLFARGGKIYEETASRMFKMPIELITKHSDERAKGKIATLACGYQGSVGALLAFGADKMGMSKEDMQETVDGWREANPNIVKYWHATGRAALAAVKGKGKQTVGKVAYHMDGPTLVCTLPSNRRLHYLGAKVIKNRFDKEAISFWGTNDKGQWARIDTHGGKLVENQTQAVARDVLFAGLMKCDEMGIEVVLHVHDEIVCEVPESFDTKILFDIMVAQLPWTMSLPLNADAQEAPYYCK